MQSRLPRDARYSRDQPFEDEILLRGGRLDNQATMPLLFRNQHNDNRKNAAEQRESAPQEALPTRRNLRCVDRHGRGYIFFTPDGDCLVFKLIYLAPPTKGQERL